MNVLQKRMMVFSIIVAILGAGGLAVMAQSSNMESQQPTQPGAPSVDPDSSEFDSFIEAMEAVQSIQEEMSVRVDELITDAPMDEDRFMEIHQQTQFGSESIDLSSAEEEQYETLASEINSAQQGYQEEMIEVIENHDLTVDRFNAIVYAVQQNVELREALNDSL